MRKPHFRPGTCSRKSCVCRCSKIVVRRKLRNSKVLTSPSRRPRVSVGSALDQTVRRRWGGRCRRLCRRRPSLGRTGQGVRRDRPPGWGGAWGWGGGGGGVGGGVHLSLNH